MFNPGQAPTAPAPAPAAAPRQPGSGFGPPPAPAATSPSGVGVGMHHRPAQGSMASGLFGGEGSSDVAAAAGQMAARAGLAQAQSLAAQYVPGEFHARTAVHWLLNGRGDSTPQVHKRCGCHCKCTFR